MPIRRILAHLLILTYLAVTIAAFVFTLTGWAPQVGWRLVRFSYAMMAPYAGYQVTNTDLVAEGRKEEGVWVRLDLDPYYPFSAGETEFRRVLRFRSEEGRHLRRYAQLAERLLTLERERGRPYSAIRLFWEEWPSSPDGRETLRLPPFTTRTFLREFP